MTDFFLSHGSYLGIIVFMILTGAGLPLPEEVAIVAAGVLSSLGQLNPWLAVGSCLIGALAGDCVMYWIGHHFGRRVLREHHWWTRFIHPEREAQIEQKLKEHSFKVLLLSRFLVGLRSPVYLAAGILRLPFKRFILIDLVCATLVIGTFFSLSYFCGQAIYKWIRGIEFGVTTIAVIAGVSVGIYFWRRHIRKKAKLAVTDSDLSAEEDEQPPESLAESGEEGNLGDWPGAGDNPPDLALSDDPTDAISEGAAARRAP